MSVEEIIMQEWYKDAKLGIMLHWGLYSVNGIPESWSFFREEISYEDMRLINELCGLSSSY